MIQKEDDEMVAIYMRIPKGARDYLLSLAMHHHAYQSKQGSRRPSIQTLLRFLSAGVIKTVKGYEILEDVGVEPYPYTRGLSTNTHKTMAEKQYDQRKQHAKKAHVQ